MRPIPPQCVLPSQKMVVADLGPVKMERPENWQVKMPQQQGELLTIAPQAGVTANGVGYGVLLEGSSPPNGRQIGINEMTGLLVQDMEEEQRGTTAAQRTSQLTSAVFKTLA